MLRKKLNEALQERDWAEVLAQIEKVRKNTKRLVTRCVQQSAATQVTKVPGVGPVAKQGLIEEQSGSSKPMDAMAGIEVVDLGSESALTHKLSKESVESTREMAEETTPLLCLRQKRLSGTMSSRKGRRVVDLFLTGFRRSTPKIRREPKRC
ncbi:uncharacterized protein A4U43_C08F16120 [Asparagus officinalis]|nr:uncharacterized protein A4U43_C08F16120 [Asparagus officinalis]